MEPQGLTLEMLIDAVLDAIGSGNLLLVLGPVAILIGVVIKRIVARKKAQMPAEAPTEVAKIEDPKGLADVLKFEKP